MAFESHQNSARGQVSVPAAAAAVAQDTVVGRSPIAGRVTDVALIPEAGIAVDAANYRTFRLVNRGQGGAGTTVVATLGTNATALATHDEARLSVVDAGAAVAEGDVLVIDEVVTGTGAAHSGYQLVCEIER